LPIAFFLRGRRRVVIVATPRERLMVVADRKPRRRRYAGDALASSVTASITLAASDLVGYVPNPRLSLPSTEADPTRAIGTEKVKPGLVSAG
jgi:hypothetical protein